MRCMMNGAGRHVYKELGRAFIKNGLTGCGLDSAKSVFTWYLDNPGKRKCVILVCIIMTRLILFTFGMEENLLINYKHGGHKP